MKDVDVNFLVEHLQIYSHKWRVIGISLNFLHDELENIRLSSQDITTELLLTDLLSRWSQWPTRYHSDVPTLERLCSALRSNLVGLGAKANELYELRNQLPSQIKTR